MTDLAIASNTGITELLKMPVPMFYEFYMAAARIVEKRNKKK